MFESIQRVTVQEGAINCPTQSKGPDVFPISGVVDYERKVRIVNV